MEYYCAICQKEAKVVDGVVLRSCGHADSAVIAPRTSVLFGDGGAGEPSVKEKLIGLFSSLAKAFG